MLTANMEDPGDKMICDALLRQAEANLRQAEANLRQAAANEGTSSAIKLFTQRLLCRESVAAVEPDRLEAWYAADGDARHPVEARMQLAATAYRRLGKLWSSKTVSIQLKLRIYKATVIAVLTHGFESWNLHPKICKYLDNWNARRLAFITGREIRDENSAPTFELPSWLQARRLKWAGELLNAADTFLPARVAKEELKRYCTPGNTQDDYGLFKGIPKASYKEILDLATQHKGLWNDIVNKIYPIRKRKREKQ